MRVRSRPATTSLSGGISLPHLQVRKELVGGLITIAVVLAAAYFLTHSGPSRGGSVQIDNPQYGGAGAPRPGSLAPDFQIKTLNGGTFRLSDFSGHPVWINFWASWCPPCREEMKDIDSLAPDLKAQGVQFVAINYGESTDDVTRFLSKGNYSFTVGLDPAQQVATLYRTLALPTQIFIDGSGVVRQIRVGSLTRTEMQAAVSSLSTPASR